MTECSVFRWFSNAGRWRNMVVWPVALTNIWKKKQFWRDKHALCGNVETEEKGSLSTAEQVKNVWLQLEFVCSSQPLRQRMLLQNRKSESKVCLKRRVKTSTVLTNLYMCRRNALTSNRNILPLFASWLVVMVPCQLSDSHLLISNRVASEVW